jgi:O-antigen ligase
MSHAARAGAAGGERRMAHLLAYALVFSTATQLRVAGPLGPGEMLLAGWAAAVWARAALRQRAALAPPALPLVAFWAGALVLLWLGTLTATIDGYVGETVFHDLAAFCFMAVLVGTFALFGPGEEALEALTGRMMSVLLVLLGVLLAGSLALPPVAAALRGAGLSVWYGPRFSGLATNPNQLSLMMSAAPFLCLELRRRARGRGRRAWFTFLALLAVLVGLATLSDGLLLAWAAGTAVMVVAAYRNGTVLADWGRWGAFVAYAVVPLMMLACFAGVMMFWPAVQEALFGVFEYGGQGSMRMQLWTHGIEAARTSPVLGLGPGAFSGLDRPFQDFEAHNTLIDWGASTGLLGVSLYLGTLAWMFARVWRARRTLLIAVIPAVFVFGMVHYTLRQPVFWFFLLIAAGLARAAAAPRPAPEPGGGRLAGLAPA